MIKLNSEKSALTLSDSTLTDGAPTVTEEEIF